MATVAGDPVWSRGLEGPALEIAQSTASPIRVCAGPGTGKTFALMRRVCQLVESGVDPERIFVVTFSRTAAHDIRTQLSKQQVPGVDRVRASTLHSYYFRTLSKAAVLQITGRVPRPLEQFEQRVLAHDLKIPKVRPYDRCEEMIAAFEANWARLQHEEPGWPRTPEDQQFHNELTHWLKLHDCILLGELGNEMRAYLSSHPNCPERSEFDYILVDEYQDLNRADQSIIDMLAERARLMVIGDEDQSIFGFRYAQPEGIREFLDVHPGGQDLPLSVCRRCPRQVVEMANSLIRFNGSREPRELEAHPGKADGKVKIVQYRTMEEEAEGVANLISRYMKRTSTPPQDVMVLVPRRKPAELIGRHLASLGIKSHNFFFDKVLESVESQRAYSLLKLLGNPDDRIAMRSWLGLGHPQLAVSPYKQLLHLCEERDLTITEGLEYLCSLPKPLRWSPVLVDRYTAWKELHAAGESLTGPALIEFVFPEDEPNMADLRRLALLCLEDTDEELTAAKLVDMLREEINYPQPPEGGDYVRIMSPYKSKGLTAKLVVVASCVEGWMPSIKDGVSRLEELRQEEEQRRLFYVAITRCTHAMVISSFNEMPSSDANQLRLKPQRIARGRATGLTSRFLGQLGPSAPKATSG